MANLTIMYVCRYKIEKDTDGLSEDDKSTLQNSLLENAKTLKESRTVSFNESYGTIDLIQSLSFGELNVSSMGASFIQNGNIIFVHEKERILGVFHLNCYEGFFGIISVKNDEKYVYIYYEKEQSITIANKITELFSGPTLSKRTEKNVRKMKLPDCMPPPPPLPDDEKPAIKAHTMDNRTVNDESSGLKSSEVDCSTIPPQINGSNKFRKKITKADIGKPSNFRHVEHCGMDGEFSTGKLDDEVNQPVKPAQPSTSVDRGLSNDKLTSRPKSLGAESILTGMGKYKMNIKLPINSPGRGKSVQKSDIGTPMNFRHKDHIGYDESFFESPDQEKYVGKYLEDIGLECLLRNGKTTEENVNQNCYSQSSHDNLDKQSNQSKDMTPNSNEGDEDEQTCDEVVQNYASQDDLSHEKVNILPDVSSSQAEDVEQNNKADPQSSLDNPDRLSKHFEYADQVNNGCVEENPQNNDSVNFTNVDLDKYNMSVL